MSDQLFIPDDLFMPWQKPTVRTTDPETSHAAARTLTRAGTMRRTLLEVFGAADCTAEEAGVRAGYTAADGAWKRVSDLRVARLIEETGATRRASTGRQQRVMRITPREIRPAMQSPTPSRL